MGAEFIIGIVLLVLVVTIVVKSVVIVPQEWAYIIERLGRYHSIREGGPAILVPFVDRTRERVDLREQVVSFPPQPVITQN
uniref:SPFH domain-containing protein n=1 Tax=Acuticoccus kandeliae TaxID=2073160 RepID=UPI0031834A66